MFALMTRSGEGVQSASLISSAYASARWGIELSVLPLQPRLVIVGIFDCECGLRDLERSETIHHHCQLVGVLGADARLRAARMRTVRNSIGVVRNAAELDSLAAHELTRRVIQHLVRIDVAVIIRSGNCLRMEIIGTRAERADDESISLKGLVHRRGLVHAPDDRFEIVDVE